MVLQYLPKHIPSKMADALFVENHSHRVFGAGPIVGMVKVYAVLWIHQVPDDVIPVKTRVFVKHQPGAKHVDRAIAVMCLWQILAPTYYPLDGLAGEQREPAVFTDIELPVR